VLNIEIERRYLFNSCNIEKLLKKNGINYVISSMEQFYLKATSSETLRYRKDEDKYIKNIKKGSGLAREEYEKEVSKKRYKKAKKVNSGGIIKKERLKFFVNGYKFELDIFKGKLKGLSILEIEFNTLKKAQDYKTPTFLENRVIKEVTQEHIYSNGALSRSMQIPLRDDSHISLNEILNTHKAKKPKLDLYISEYESTQSILKNYIKRLLVAFRLNYNKFFKNKNIEDLKLSIKAIRRLKSIVLGFKSYINNDSYLEILFNINNFLLVSEEFNTLNSTFKTLLKQKSTYSIEKQTAILKHLIKIAQNLKTQKENITSTFTTENMQMLENSLDKIELKNRIKIPYTYAKQVILEKQLKKVKKTNKYNTEELFTQYYTYKTLATLFKVKIDKKSYKNIKNAYKIIKYQQTIKNNDFITHNQKKYKYKIPFKNLQKNICNGN